MTKIPGQSESRWPHRLAVMLACATFPLIWVGGLVTTYDAGMAVPDWPNTYGYNLFLYPWTTWVLGPWDIFIEHGHRLLGALVGLLTIALNVAVWRYDSRRWLRCGAAGALLVVIAHGMLGGLRVLENSRDVARIHACLGPLFFGVTVALAVVTSRLWHSTEPRWESPAAASLQRWAMLTTALVYLQLILGAHLRHVSSDWSAVAVRGVLTFHLLIAALIAVHVGLLAFRTRRMNRSLRLPALSLVSLLVCQLILGAGTWIVKYNWPNWFADVSGPASYTVVSDSWWQASVVTAHVAMGSLILAFCVQLTARSLRLLRPATLAVCSVTLLKGAAA